MLAVNSSVLPCMVMVLVGFTCLSDTHAHAQGSHHVCQSFPNICGENSRCFENGDSYKCECLDVCGYKSVTSDGANCEETSHLTEFAGECPCFCGGITTKQTRQCVWYEQGADGTCQQRASASDASRCAGAELDRDWYCYNGSCLINMVQDKTNDDHGDANTWDNVYYMAVTISGQYCWLGKLDLPGTNDRKLGAIDTYYINKNCDACMLSATETFDFMWLTIDGNDGWLCDWVLTEVNGNNATYTNGGWLDSHGWLKFVQ